MHPVTLLTTLLAVAILATSGFGGNSFPAEIRQLGVETITLVYQEKFAEAQETAKRIIKKFPDHPAGYFFSAAATDAWTEYFQSNKKEEEFYRYCDLASSKGQDLMSRNPTDPWLKFFVGGTEGLKGNYEKRYDRWITAFRYGWKGVSLLKEVQVQDPDIHDVNYGIGTYDYWRSAMTHVMSWMPGVEDQRASGIERLTDAMGKGVFTTTASASNLVMIMVNEKRNDDALRIANEVLATYPTCLQFHWGKAMALYGLGRWPEAEQVFRLILSRVESEELDNHYNAIVCHLWLAKVYLKQNRPTQVVAEYNRMRYYKISDDIRKRLEKYLAESEQLKGQAEAMQ